MRVLAILCAVLLVVIVLAGCEAALHAVDWVATDLVRQHDDTPWCAEGCEP